MRAITFLFLAFALPIVTDAASSYTNSPAIKNVLGMLNNLITTLDAESQKDEETFTHFSAWCTTQITDTGINIERLQGVIEETSATLGHLRAKRGELEQTVANLQQNLATEQQQLQMAMEKRGEEHSSFVREQQDFDSAIKACGTASEVLSKHYGSGEEEPLEKPAWMSLVSEQIATVRRVAKSHGKVLKMVELLQTRVHAEAKGRNLRQAPGGTINNDRYAAKTGEGLNIVDQIGELTETFSQDKQSALNDENRLQGLFNTLQAEKTAMINQLTAELQTQTGLLTRCNQDIAENEGKLARAERELKDDQEYMKRTTQLKNDATDAYNTRQADRKAERGAVVQATQVLDSFLKPSFVQRGAALQRLGTNHAVAMLRDSVAQKHMAALTSSLGDAVNACPKCKAAASLLSTRASKFHSELLQAAALAAENAGNEAITEIVGSLEKMVSQLKQDQRSEDEHKGWCDKELGITNNKVQDHSSIIDHLKATLANLGEVLVEEKEEREENHAEEVDEDNNFDQLTHVRGEEKEDFEHAHGETVEAIAALNQAIDILAKFYASRDKEAAALLQQPGGGGQVVGMISEVRSEFEHAKKNLEVDEKSAEDEFGENRELHMKTDGNIQTDENVIDTEMQTTKQELEVNTDDLGQEKEDKVSTESYLDQLGRSCYMLINNYEDRKKRRGEEGDAIREAIKVLEEEA